jgi:tetratricopeptide (TPR) repeat protein
LAVAAAIGIGSGSGAAAPEREPDTLPVPPVPAAASSATVELPAVPSFELAPAEPGLHDVRELRVRGRALLGSELTVSGYIVWIYDCLTALAKPGMTIVELQERIDDNPGLCERPKFALGASPTASLEAALWVVDVPRPPNKRERIALTDVQLRNRPAVPVIAVGDFVVVTGRFGRSSPHGERNSDGLVVYRALRHATPSAPLAAPVATPSAAPSPGPAAEPPVATMPPLRAIVPMWKRNDSIEHYERCNQALAAGQLDDAVASCRRALAIWAGNHLAWYALGNAHAMREHWLAASDAYDRAVQLRPDSPMYQLYAGITRYKLAQREKRADGARPDDAASAAAALRALERDATVPGLALRPYQLAAALSRQRLSPQAWFEPARQALTQAASLAPALALAHEYLGEVLREQDRPRPAAEAFTRAIRADPSQPRPYVALVELYRSWDYTAQSLAVAQQAVRATAPASPELWLELGMAHEAMRHDADAIAAFSRAIEGGNLQARFQRGQIEVRRNELASARRDLESFLAAAGPSLAFARQIATGLLVEIARKQGLSQPYMRLPTRLDPSDAQRHH